jgi:hypothetical protein
LSAVLAQRDGKLAAAGQMLSEPRQK